MPRHVLHRPLALLLAPSLLATWACGDTLQGVTGDDGVTRNYTTSCFDLDQQFPTDTEGVTVTFDDEGRAAFAWDGPAAQQVVVWNDTRDEQAWNVAYSPEEGWRTQNFETFNALESGLVYGVYPEALDAEDFDVMTDVQPLQPGEAYSVFVVIGCYVDPEEYGSDGPGGNSGVGPGGTFVAP